MKTGTLDKLKFDVLKKLLGLPKYQVMGLLEGLWYMTATNAPDGAIGKHSNLEIAAWLEWQGDENHLVESLIKARFLDRSNTHRLVVHDWAEHCPTHIRGNMAKHRREFAQVGDAPVEIFIHPELPREQWEQVRIEVLERDNYTCRYCSAEASAVDHRIPRSRGGSHDKENLVATCNKCNSSKGSSTEEEFLASCHSNVQGNLLSNVPSNSEAGGVQRPSYSNQTKPNQTKPNHLTDPPPDPAPRKHDYPPEFDRTWAIYPRRNGDNPKRSAMQAWNARRKAGHTAEVIHAGVERYAAWCKATGKIGTETVKQAATFFGPDECFLQPWDIPAGGKPVNGYPRTDEQWMAKGRELGINAKPGESMSAYTGRLKAAIEGQHGHA